MTGLAIIVGQGMIVRFTVAIRTTAIDLVMIHRKHILPIAPRGVTCAAHIGGIRVIGGLVRGVAIFAIPIDLIMIYGKDRIPLGTGAMASFADIGRIGMGGRFIIPMAGFARTVDLSMIYADNGDPCRIVMAGLTHIRGINVCRGFAGGRRTIVAIEAGLPRDRSMIELGIPVRCIVTGIARFGGGQMIGAFTNGDHIIMAIGAQPQYLSVIHRVDLP